VTVEIADAEGCPRYSGLLIEGVAIGPSPDWMRRRLEASGVRAINNVVDCTNYVLWELGQPLHAFDFDLLTEGHIIVRKAAAGETMTTLDGMERRLTDQDLLICDPRGPVALAGVMGGGHTEISDRSTRVLLEAAHFDPATIRRTSQRLGLSTEASYRFERHVDPNLTLRALARTAELILQTAGGMVPARPLTSAPSGSSRAGSRCGLAAATTSSARSLTPRRWPVACGGSSSRSSRRRTGCWRSPCRRCGRTSSVRLTSSRRSRSSPATPTSRSRYRGASPAAPC